jgi:photosystem II stability/assembly factor-like uncharacterized protein
VFDPKDRRHVFVAFGGYRENNLWETRDSGGSWKPLGPRARALDMKVPVYSLAIHPADSRRLYLATEIGLFCSTDGGQNWLTPREFGPNSCAVDDLQWMNHKLIVVSHGRGLFRIDLTGLVREP